MQKFWGLLNKKETFYVPNTHTHTEAQMQVGRSYDHMNVHEGCVCIRLWAFKFIRLMTICDSIVFKKSPSVRRPYAAMSFDNQAKCSLFSIKKTPGNGAILKASGMFSANLSNQNIQHNPSQSKWNGKRLALEGRKGSIWWQEFASWLLMSE